MSSATHSIRDSEITGKPEPLAEVVRGERVEIASGEKSPFPTSSSPISSGKRRCTTPPRPAQPKKRRSIARAADAAYRNRLKLFEKQYGRIIRAYWCTYELSGVAITEEHVRHPWWKFRASERRERLHSATDWATRDSPELAHQLHRIDNLSVRADEILRGSAEKIAMQLLACAASHILSYVDRKNGAPKDPATIKKIIDRSEAELAAIRQHYRRAGENATRIVYAGGMLRGAILLAFLTGIADSYSGRPAISTATRSNLDIPRNHRRRRDGSRSQRPAAHGQRQLLPRLRTRPKNQPAPGDGTPLRRRSVRDHDLPAPQERPRRHRRPQHQNQTIYFYAAVGFLAGLANVGRVVRRCLRRD